MIPKRALFYWEGPEPSWLRRQSWESFRAHNPDWDVTVLGPSERATRLIPGTGRLACVQRSDLTRYEALAETGGVYLDSDIVFFRPFPEMPVTAEVAMPMLNKTSGAIVHIATLGAKQGSRFFRLIAEMAAQRSQAPGRMGYQSLGINLFNGIDVRGLAASQGAEELYPLDFRMILTAGWAEPEVCFSPVPAGFQWHHGAVGLHWFGGDHGTIEVEPESTMESLKGTLLGKALQDSGVLCAP